MQSLHSIFVAFDPLERDSYEGCGFLKWRASQVGVVINSLRDQRAEFPTLKLRQTWPRLGFEMITKIFGAPR